MYTLTYLALIAVYAFVALGVTWSLVKLAGRRGAHWKVKTLVVLLTITVFVLIPIWDIPLAQREFEQSCQTEAGLKLIKSVDGAPGFVTSFLRGKGSAEGFLKRDGYEFVEDEDAFHKYTRYTLDKEGELVQQQIDKPSARYRFEQMHTFLRYVIRREMFIEDVQTKEKLATQIAITPRGGWLSQWFRLSYGAFTCEPQQMPIREFLTQTLKPSRRQHRGA